MTRRKVTLTVSAALATWAEVQLYNGPVQVGPMGFDRDSTTHSPDEALSIAAYVEEAPRFGRARKHLWVTYIEKRDLPIHSEGFRAIRKFKIALARKLIREPWRPPDMKEARAGLEVADEAVSYAERRASERVRRVVRV